MLKKIIKTVEVEGMKCKHCALKVENKLKEIESVKKVKVNLSDKRVSIISSMGIRDELIKEKIESLGYKVIL